MLESVKIRLRVAGKLTPEIERRILEFERICISEIRSESLRYAVLDYLENVCPLDFYTAPASASGGHHPESVSYTHLDVYKRQREMMKSGLSALRDAASAKRCSRKTSWRSG